MADLGSRAGTVSAPTTVSLDSTSLSALANLVAVRAQTPVHGQDVTAMAVLFQQYLSPAVVKKELTGAISDKKAVQAQVRYEAKTPERMKEAKRQEQELDKLDEVAQAVKKPSWISKLKDSMKEGLPVNEMAQKVGKYFQGEKTGINLGLIIDDSMRKLGEGVQKVTKLPFKEKAPKPEKPSQTNEDSIAEDLADFNKGFKATVSEAKESPQAATPQVGSNVTGAVQALSLTPVQSAFQDAVVPPAQDVGRVFQAIILRATPLLRQAPVARPPMARNTLAPASNSPVNASPAQNAKAQVVKGNAGFPNGPDVKLIRANLKQWSRVLRAQELVYNSTAKSGLGRFLKSITKNDGSGAKKTNSWLNLIMLGVVALTAVLIAFKDYIGPAVGRIANVIASIFEGTKDALITFLNSGLAVLTKAMRVLVEILEAIKEPLKNVFINVLNILNRILEKVADKIPGLVDSLMTFAETGVKFLTSIIEALDPQVFASIINNIAGVISALTGAVKEIAIFIKDNIGSALESVKEVVVMLWNDLFKPLLNVLMVMVYRVAAMALILSNPGAVMELLITYLKSLFAGTILGEDVPKGMTKEAYRAQMRDDAYAKFMGETGVGAVNVLANEKINALNVDAAQRAVAQGGYYDDMGNFHYGKATANTENMSEATLRAYNTVYQYQSTPSSNSQVSQVGN